MIESPGKLSLRKIDQSADIAVHLIEFLSARGTIISEDQYNAISATFEDYAPDGDDELDAYKFWKAYGEIVALLPADIDPMNVYYSQLYVTKDLEGVPDQQAAAVRFGRRTTLIITWFSVFILTMVVFALAYASTLRELAKEGRVLDLDYLYMIEERYHQVKQYQLEPCADPQNNCHKKTQDRMASNLDSTIKNANRVLGVGIFTEDLIDTVNPSVSARVLQAIDVMLGVLNGYVIPLLAGVLGASLSILREIYVGVQKSSLSVKIFRTAYIRIALGAISGIAVGWFSAWFNGDPKTAVLGPLAFAFAAGYAVEVIFSLLDRLVLVLTNNKDDADGARS
ncbi:MAG: hypothetical protein NXI27_11945 [Alphaproteobacteria bacterium]|nr:hypothetical protein [Alphaproteobacteria bacterium]